MKTFTSLLSCILMVISSIEAQKTLQAYRIDQDIHIDGILDESLWQKAEIATDFVNLRPKFGVLQKQKTFVKVLYDDNAIYISAVMNEVSRDSIITELTQRDQLGNTDFLGVAIDTYGKGADGLEFIVGATGVQFDAKMQDQGNEDTSWDAVWHSAVIIDDNSWTCEIKIPYSAIRFPKKETQEWVINFFRKQARNNVQSFWSPLDPEKVGIFSQSGKLQNLHNIKPPVRLSFSPYFSTYALNHNGGLENPGSSTGYTYNGGMDVKYGISDAYTLDMTLIPDFGQVESDDKVVNLSPYEIRFDEKRPFFTEGLELFEKGNIFYSRRIGGLPLNYDKIENDLPDNQEIISNQAIPQLYNATKVSGRSSNGVGVGVLNAIEGETFAKIRNLDDNSERSIMTQPLTNYNVVVVDKSLKNNSHIALINTNVWRKGAAFYDANVTAIDFNMKNNKQKYGLRGKAIYSLQTYDEGENVDGHVFELEFSKLSGNFNYWLGYGEESPNYNPNDLGYLQSANSRNSYIGASYSIYEPFGAFNRANFWTNFNYNRIVEPNKYTGWWFNTGFWVQSKNFFEYNLWFNKAPVRYDYFEPRVTGRYLTIPSLTNTGINIGTDQRKKIAANFYLFGYKVSEQGRYGYELSLSPRWRINNKFTLSLNANLEKSFKDTGFVDFGDANEIYMGQRNRTTIYNLISARYNFTEKIGLNLRTRHYWSKAAYQSFHELSNEGQLLATDFKPFADFSFNSLNVDLNFNWRFAPGSDLFINWKNNISGYQSNEWTNYSTVNYQNGLQELSDLAQDNSISLRIVYYLDYLDIKKRL